MAYKDPEKQRAYAKAWREKNAERVRETQRRYDEQNREKIREYQRQRYLEKREAILKREAERYRDDPEFRKAKIERSRKWELENPEANRRRRRASWAKRLYGLTLDELDALMARGCALCGATEHLHVDHCHTSGKVRAALCRSCNTGLGHFGDDPARLRAAADYLEKHR